VQRIRKEISWLKEQNMARTKNTVRKQPARLEIPARLSYGGKEPRSAGPAAHAAARIAAKLKRRLTKKRKRKLRAMIDHTLPFDVDREPVEKRARLREYKEEKEHKEGDSIRKKKRIRLDSDSDEDGSKTRPREHKEEKEHKVDDRIHRLSGLFGDDLDDVMGDGSGDGDSDGGGGEWGIGGGGGGGEPSDDESTNTDTESSGSDVGSIGSIIADTDSDDERQLRPSASMVRAALDIARNAGGEKRVSYETVMEQYKKDITRVRQHMFDKNSLTTVQCSALTEQGTGPRCKLKTTIYPMFCWLHTQLYTGCKLIHSHIKGAGIGIQTLRDIPMVHEDDEGGTDFSKNVAEFTGEVIEEGVEVEPGDPDDPRNPNFVVDGLSTFDSQHGLARLVNTCRKGSVVPVDIRRYVKKMTGRPIGCRDTNVAIVTNAEDDRVYLMPKRAIRRGEELTVDYGDAFYGGVAESDRERADDVDDEGGEDLRPIIRSLIPEVDSTDEDADDAPSSPPHFAELHELHRATRAARAARLSSRAAGDAPVVAVVPAPGIAPVVLSAARIAEIRAGGHCSSAESAALGALDDVAAVPVSVDKDKSAAAVEARRLAWNEGRDDSRHKDKEKKRRALYDSQHGRPG
jgi:hypothetical protein